MSLTKTRSSRRWAGKPAQPVCLLVHPEFAGSKIIIFPMIFWLETQSGGESESTCMHAQQYTAIASLSYMKYSVHVAVVWHLTIPRIVTCLPYILPVILKCRLLANSVSRNSLNCARCMAIVPRITSCVNCNSKINCGHAYWLYMSFQELFINHISKCD